MAKKQKIKITSVDDVDLLFMILLARSYYRTGKLRAANNIISFQSVGEELVFGDEASQPKISQDQAGAYFTVGVNLSLSLELYIKAITLIMGKDFGQVHGLTGLYNELPHGVKVEIEKIYADLTKNSRQSDVINSWVFRKGEPSYDADHAKTLQDVINHTSQMFVNWRYLYEIEVQKKYPGYTFSLQYRAIKRACIAMRKFIRIRRLINKRVARSCIFSDNKYPQHVPMFGIKSVSYTALDESKKNRMLLVWK